MTITTDIAKTIAKNLRKELSKLELSLSHGATLNLLSRAFGFKDYNTFVPELKNTDTLVVGVTSRLEELEEKVDEASETIEEHAEIKKRANLASPTLALSYLDEILEAESSKEVGELLINLAGEINKLHNKSVL